jgi:AraC family transcriptional regulator
VAAWGKFERLVAGDVRVRDFRCWGEKRPFSKDTARDDAGARRPLATDDAHDVELELPRRGAHLRAYGRDTFVVDVTTVAVLPATAEYLRASPSNAPQTSTLITLSGELAERVARAKSRVLSVSRASARAHERLLACTSPLAIHEHAIALVEALSLDAGEPSSTPAAHRSPTAAWKRLVAQVEYVLATRYAEELTLDEIARASGVSPFHAARVFRSVTGRSIHQQLVRVRVHHALYELSRGAGALTEVALRAGFSSHSHFTSTFRRLMGVTPSELAANRRAGF